MESSCAGVVLQGTGVEGEAAKYYEKGCAYSVVGVRIFWGRAAPLESRQLRYLLPGNTQEIQHRSCGGIRLLTKHHVR